MKYIFFMVALLAANYTIAQKKTSQLYVEAANYPKDTIRVVWNEGAQMIEKKIPLYNGKGHIEINAPEYTDLIMVNDDDSKSIKMGDGTIPGPMLFFFSEPGKKLTIQFKNEEWPAVSISGGKTNQEYMQYWKEAGPLESRLFDIRKQLILNTSTDTVEIMRKQREVQETDTRITELQKSFIKKHPESYTSLFLLQGHSVMMPVQEYEKKFLALNKTVRETSTGKKVAAWIASAKRTQIGQPAANFTKKDKDGKIIRLADYRGKYVLIDFWGTWCIPCRKSHPHLVSLFEKYGKDNIAFINIAQEGGDNPRGLWLKAIEEDGMTWTQILNNEGQEKSDVVKLYSIQAFPTKILIDKEGKILKRFSGDAKEIDQALMEIFGR